MIPFFLLLVSGRIFRIECSELTDIGGNGNGVGWLALNLVQGSACLACPTAAYPPLSLVRPRLCSRCGALRSCVCGHTVARASVGPVEPLVVVLGPFWPALN